MILGLIADLVNKQNLDINSPVIYNNSMQNRISPNFVRRRIFSIFASAIAVILLSVLPLSAADIIIGNTESEVREILGNPKGKMKNGSGSMWLYDTAEINFQNGKVRSISTLAERPKPVPAPAAPTPKPVQVAVERPSQPVAQPVQVIASADSKLPINAKDLKQVWTDASGTPQSRIICTFGLPVLKADAREAARQKGTVPYRLTAAVLVPKSPGDTKMTLVRTGSCLLRLYDENGSEVLNTTVPADKLCPS